MKKYITVLAVVSYSIASAQFSVNLNVNSDYPAKEAILYTLDGSKDIISSKENRKGNSFVFQVAKAYSGMMKIYFPETNASFNLISENKEVKVDVVGNGKKIVDINYLDEANRFMTDVQDYQKKREAIFPALLQIKEYYKPSSDFAKALEKEISQLEQPLKLDATAHPFVYFYNTNYNKFLVEQATSPKPTAQEIIHFVANSNQMLESSSLLRPVLVAYLNQGGNANIEKSVRDMLTAVNVETPRGQTVLSEFIDIFDAYGMTDYKTKFLTEATNLKCTINDRLAKTIKVNKDTEMGAKFPNYTFQTVKGTTAKSLYDIKADKKIIVFWSSTCSHCEKEVPQFIEKYATLKQKNIEVIGFSLDTEKSNYDSKVSAFPWINTTELRGWNSTFAEMYNIHATPTYFILDSNNVIINKPDHIQDVFNFFNLK